MLIVCVKVFSFESCTVHCMFFSRTTVGGHSWPEEKPVCSMLNKDQGPYS